MTPGPVHLSAWALWDGTGVVTSAAGDVVSVPGLVSGLAPWPSAKPLAALHPRARRPTRAAVALIQLADAVLSSRSVAPGDVDILLGTAAGSSAVDREFQEGLDQRGAAFGSPSTFVYTLATAAPAELSIALGMRAAMSTVTAGSASGLLSLVRGAARISSGRSAACLCGELEMGGTGAPERISLFLLEARGPGRTVEDWESGFGGHVAGAAGETLRTLARTLEPGSFLAADPEGSWARLTLGARP